MIKDKRFFLKDLKSVTAGFLSTFSSFKSEIDNLIQIKIEKLLNSKGYVSREDFHALEDRVDKLQSEIILMKKNYKK